MNNKGFSFTELMFAIAIFGLVLGGIIAVSLSTQQMDRDTITQSTLLANATIAIERIQTGQNSLYGLMKARNNSIIISNNDTRIRFHVDKNAEYTESTADDTQMSFQFDNGDGDDNTYSDNIIIMDPDTSVNGDEVTIAKHIESLTFSLDGNIVTVNLTVTDVIQGEEVSLNLARDIWIRN